MYCVECNCEVVEKHAEKLETYKVKDKEYTVRAKVSVCPYCGNELWDPEAEDRIIKEVYNKYRDEMGLLRPEEIKDIREQYELSQSAFAKLLGFGEKTITRYENGALQDEVQNNFLLLMKLPSNFKVIYEKNVGRLNDIDKIRAKNALKKHLGVWHEAGNDYCFAASNLWDQEDNLVGW